MVSGELQEKAINTIRFLALDGVEKANSGHPGLPMGAAAMAFTIWTRHLRHNPANPKWADRDRFVLSGGHGSMLQYALLYLTGYDLSMDELRSFRQWDSRTPGHPEYGWTPGVEVTTGPLGQGFANGVGMAIAEAHLAATFNQPDLEIVDHYTYAIVTDGDLMEGVASEAASLAGHQRLGKLIYLYDNNHISIDGSTDLAFTEDRAARFAAYGWNVLTVENGNDVEAIDDAIQQAKQDPRPSLIVVTTTIGYGLPKRAGTAKAHGEPAGEEEVAGARRALNWPAEPEFLVPDDVLGFFREAVMRGQALENEWQERVQRYQDSYPVLGAEFIRRIENRLTQDWDQDLPEFPADGKGMATRASSGKVLNALADCLPELMGGSADLTPSNNTSISSSSDFQSGNRGGRYIRFGVREHAMGSIANGMAVHGGIIPYTGTFLVFSDYMRPAIRLAALAAYPTIFLFTHDSIGLGEDGPTHQPVEHLAALRAIPGMTVIRPADANEVREMWKNGVARRNAPTLFALTRQPVPTLDRSRFAPATGLHRGAYVLADLGQGQPQLILMASGSEVAIIVEAGERLAGQGVPVRLVSFPSWELFDEQGAEYQREVLPADIPLRISVEAGVSQGWERWVGPQGRVVAVDRFGASAPYQKIYEEYGLTPERVVREAMELLGQVGGKR